MNFIIYFRYEKSRKRINKKSSKEKNKRINRVKQKMKEEIFNKLVQNIESPKNFEIIYKYYYPKVLLRLYIQFGDRVPREDVAQEFFMKLFSKKPDRYIKYPNNWVYGFCDHLANNYLVDEQEYRAVFLKKEPREEDKIFEKTLYGDYIRRIRSLDEMTRKIIIMHFCEGYTLKEVAEITGEQYNNVRQKCSRGIKMLRD